MSESIQGAGGESLSDGYGRAEETADIIRLRIDSVMLGFNEGVPDTSDKYVAIREKIQEFEARYTTLLGEMAAFGHGLDDELSEVAGKVPASREALAHFLAATLPVADRDGVTAVEASMKGVRGNAIAETSWKENLMRTIGRAVNDIGDAKDRGFGHITDALYHVKTNSIQGEETKQQVLQRAADLDTRPLITD